MLKKTFTLFFLLTNLSIFGLLALSTDPSINITVKALILLSLILFDAIILLTLRLLITQNSIHNKLQKEISALKVQNLDIKNTERQFLVKHIDNLYKRGESLFRINQRLDSKEDWGSFTDWAIYSDTAMEIISRVKPSDTILELGSGITTIIISQYLKTLGSSDAKLITIEHDENFYNATKNRLTELNLTELCELHYCPLVKSECDGDVYQWYDFTKLKLHPETINKLIVDGPPSQTNKNARYPAYPLLKTFLSKDSSIFLDDGHRTDEKDIADKWVNHYSLIAKSINNTKGLFIFTH